MGATANYERHNHLHYISKRKSLLLYANSVVVQGLIRELRSRVNATRWALYS